MERIMPTGNVKWFNAEKGFGFIQPSDGGGDVFVHISAVQQAGLRTLNDGQKVIYDLELDRKGKTAAVNLLTSGEAKHPCFTKPERQTGASWA
jgi:CspA family cold shock protein